MKRILASLVFCLLVGVASLTTGCSKISKFTSTPKVIAAAIITGITSTFGYLGRSVGIERNKGKKRARRAARMERFEKEEREEFEAAKLEIEKEEKEAAKEAKRALKEGAREVAEKERRAFEDELEGEIE